PAKCRQGILLWACKGLTEEWCCLQVSLPIPPCSGKAQLQAERQPRVQLSVASHYPATQDTQILRRARLSDRRVSRSAGPAGWPSSSAMGLRRLFARLLRRDRYRPCRLQPPARELRQLKDHRWEMFCRKRIQPS